MNAPKTKGEKSHAQHTHIHTRGFSHAAFNGTPHWHAALQITYGELEDWWPSISSSRVIKS